MRLGCGRIGALCDLSLQLWSTPEGCLPLGVTVGAAYVVRAHARRERREDPDRPIFSRHRDIVLGPQLA